MFTHKQHFYQPIQGASRVAAQLELDTTSAELHLSSKQAQLELGRLQAHNTGLHLGLQLGPLLGSCKACFVAIEQVVNKSASMLLQL